MIPEVRVMVNDGKSAVVEGYFTTLDQLTKLARDFQADCHDGFISNDRAYVKEWLKKEARLNRTPDYCFRPLCSDMACKRGEICTADSREK